jgi:hypothetical protein
MNPEYAKQLEAQIDRVLQHLPELEAPATLLPRVWAEIERRAALPWYRRAWVTWPVGLQAAALVVLAILFGGLCLGGWQITHSAEVADATQTAGRWFAGFTLVANTLSALGNALVLAVKQLGPIFLGACVVVGLATYLSCLGLGTAFVRLAVARR